MHAQNDRQWGYPLGMTDIAYKVTEVGAHRAPPQPGTQVRSLNSIYRPFGVGKVQKVRDSLCKVEFNPCVFSRPPFRSQNYILSLDEVEVYPAPLELAKAGQWDEAWKFDLRQMAARFLTMNKGGQLSNARTEILPHQIFTAFTVVSNARRRFAQNDSFEEFFRSLFSPALPSPDK